MTIETNSEVTAGLEPDPQARARDASDMERIEFDDVYVRRFVWASVIWGIVGMLVGVLIALQLAYWPANIGPWLTFGRLRPLHTNAVIFAFVGNMIFAGVYHSSQRLLKARLPSPTLTAIHFWGFQAIIVAAAITLPLGLTQGKEYAELIWPIDLAVTTVWVIFAVNFFWLVAKRRERHLYVALWFYIATIVTVAVLYVTNNLALPYSGTQSYGIFGGVQDALVQWWYGHNAVAFFLTTPILGIMYYYIPKAADRPVFSYRLSIIHFWSLIFLYIWAGPHHLLNTALPDWAQSLGMVFSVMLWAPSWGGMLNGLLTLRGAWDKLRTDPVLKFFAAAVTFYGMATFEGPLLSIRVVNELAHYTDWIIGHVHGGALGWNGFMAAGMFYWLVPRLYGTQLHSRRAADWHFYLGTIGILVYMVSMYVAGLTQNMMWRAETDDGGLRYSFLEGVAAIVPMYWFRAVGGTMYLVGFIIMAWNLAMTARAGHVSTGHVDVVREAPAPAIDWKAIVLSSPVLLVSTIAILLGVSAIVNELAGIVFVSLAVAVTIVGTIYVRAQRATHAVHHDLEGHGIAFVAFVTISILVGGVAELAPSVAIGMTERATTGQHPYTPLELEGRDIYVSEGCYTCHSQMVRPFVWESTRFGAVSETSDSIWDHPFQWGSKRTGPDLAREGVRNPDARWHYAHMIDPRQSNADSIMPAYAALETTTVDFGRTANKLRAQQALGVPYTREDIAHAAEDARAQAEGIVTSLGDDYDAIPDSQLVALIAYLQRLGRTESTFTPARAASTATAVSRADH